MAERKIRTKEDILKVISEMIKKKSTTVRALEKKLGIGAGTVSRWNKADPGLSTILEILEFLGIEVILKYQSSETSQETENEQLDIDVKIIYRIMQILKNPNTTISDKEKIYKILQAFL